MNNSNDTCSSVLVVNAGSTSTKLSVVGDDDAVTWSHTAEAGDDAMERAFEDAGAALDNVTAVGHRIVHGGARFVEPVMIDAEVVAEIAALTELAPLHNAPGLVGISVARDKWPDLPQVACFDTAFHATMPDAARAYGGPHRWLADGLRRYGFHGLSHEHATMRSAELVGRPIADLRLVSCHLGGGSSLAAVDRGRSVDTTMGFTPLDGLVMATRSGSVDPGLLLHLLRKGTSVDDLDDVLERQSGVLGLSGVGADLRAVIAARDGGDERARLAVDVYVHRLITGIGAMAGALGGLDAIVFTGGIGEHSAEVRARAVDAFGWAGAVLDERANATASGDVDISGTDARVRVLVVEAREDLVIARAARTLLEVTWPRPSL
jgi:acetate kinase